MTGIVPILQLSFDEGGAVLYGDLEAEIDFALNAGVHGIALGVASELNKLSDIERDQVISAVIKHVNGRVPTVISTSGPSTALTISRSHRALELGGSMAMISPDGFGGFPAEDVRRHYNAVAEAIDIPIMLQDRTGASIAPTLMAQLADDHESFRHAKVETLPTPPRFADAKRLAGDSLTLLGGVNGAFLIEEMNRGSEGAMASIALIDVLCEVWEGYRSGETGAAAERWERHTHLIEMYRYGQGMNYWMAKEILRLRGVFTSAFPRLPAHKPDETAFREVREMCERLGLI
ncbi:MAG TPA: dihydrodipicolinate synthase family protein [Dehalococcoidia bacterium]|nr:dihydrodipicolinate synthase family protein [Dehalococcoidia bacterium]MDP6273176.1 dihydrodipicolinate synthase family protein [Dehalococcoidia bacterium]MDP7161107.1 dihydrodipicolinate synthase family protein [Dehalococcoidia bacterium]MDP7213983.1 dihydrodipicolinate synthase family protein [Dehalococcoidia bacterium]MDP7514451.1 dihydrodipicolinate synthase family protein [Dehalococcoidia bacterium]